MSRRLLFLPGAGADPDFWRPLSERLPAAWGKTYLGWPGLGAQPPQPGIHGLEGLVGLVEAELGEEPVDLLAQSMGGLVAMLVALRHPRRIARMVLSVTSAGVPVRDLGGADWQADYRPKFPEAAAWVREVQVDLSAQIPGICAPTLLLWGDSDPISPVTVGERLLCLLPDARLEVLAGGDHDLVRTHATAAAALVEAHLAAPSPVNPAT